MKKTIPETYGQARVDTKRYGASELGKVWHEVNREIKITEAERTKRSNKIEKKRI